MFNDALPAKINQKIIRHERWLKQLPDGQRGNFSAMKLSGLNFNGRQLADAIFTGARLEGATFRSANLHGADFTGADCTNADFTTANLKNAAFTKAALTGANFFHAEIDAEFLRKKPNWKGVAEEKVPERAKHQWKEQHDRPNHAQRQRERNQGKHNHR